MDWTRENIVERARGLKQDIYTKTKAQIETDYADFKERFPKLYDSCMLSDFSMDDLEKILNIREGYRDGEKTKLETEITVGEYMGKRFVYNNVEEPTMEQKKEAIRKIVSKSK